MLGTLLFLGLFLPAIVAENGCTVTSSGTNGTILCTGTVPKDVNGSSWKEALVPLAGATSVTADFRDVPFSGTSFSRALDILASVGAESSSAKIDVLLTNCTLKNAEFDYANLASLAGSKSYKIRLEQSSLINNSVNMTGALVAENDFTVSLQLVNSAIKRNKLMAFGAAVVGGTGQASISLAQVSEVEQNEVFLIGGLAVGGSASLGVQLAASNVTRNKLSALGLVAVGGNATASASGLDDSTVVVERNEVDPKVEVVTQQPLATTVVGIITGLGFGASGFDLGAALAKGQAEACAALGALSPAPAGMPADQLPALQGLADELGGLLCINGSANPAVNLSAIIPQVEGLSEQGLSGVASILGGILTNSTLIKGVVAALEGGQPLGATLDDLLSAILSSADVQNGVSLLGGLISELGQWLDRPIGGGVPAGSGSAAPSEANLGAAIQSILGAIKGEEPASSVVSNITSAVADVAQQIVGAISGDGSGGGITPGGVVNSIVQALTGGADGPLAGVDVTSLLPVLGAVLSDPQAVASLPQLLAGFLGGGGSGSGGGGLDLSALGPVINAIMGNKEAAASLPDVLGLLGKLGLGLPGSS